MKQQSSLNKKLKFLVDLVTFTEEIFNGKLHFLCIGYKNDHGLYHRYKVSSDFFRRHKIKLLNHCQTFTGF